MWKKIYTISKSIISIFLSVANYDKSIEIILFTEILLLFILPVQPSASVIKDNKWKRRFPSKYFPVRRQNICECYHASC